MCRECTGHLVLREGESSARLKKQAKNKTNNQNKQTNKAPGKPRLIGSCKGETKLRKGETKGPSNYAKRTLSTLCACLDIQSSCSGHAKCCETLYCLCSSLCTWYCAWISRLRLNGCLIAEEAWATNMQVHRLRVRMVGRHDLENHCREEPNCSKQKGFLVSSSAAC